MTKRRRKPGRPKGSKNKKGSLRQLNPTPMQEDTYMINLYDRIDLTRSWMREGYKRAEEQLLWDKKEFARLRKEGPPKSPEKVIPSFMNPDEKLSKFKHPSLDYIMATDIDNQTKKTNIKAIIFDTFKFIHKPNTWMLATLILFVSIIIIVSL